MKIESGDLLIAPPAMADGRFKQSVLLLTHCYHGGTYALCVNRPTKHTVQDVLYQTDIVSSLNFPVYWGGPVDTTTVWMLHSIDWSIEQTVNINEQWAVTSNIEMFHHLADNDYPKHFRVMFGHCTWAQNQLRSELLGRSPWSHNNSWLTARDPGPEWLFEQELEKVWEKTTMLSSHQAVDSWL